MLTSRTNPAPRRSKPGPPAHGVRRARRRILAAAVLGCAMCVLTLMAGPMCAAQGEGFINREYPLKALFLYNFGSYVEWHESAFQNDDEPFVIGILGDTSIDGVLREIAATKKIAGREIAVKQFRSVDAIERCHILFVARSVGTTEQERVVERLRGLPVLIVGETSGFAARGACVNFYIESNKIRFEINLEAARQQQLRISAKLLALAKIVQ